MTRLPLAAAIALLLASQAAFSSLPTFSVWPGGEAPGAKNSPASESLVERSKDPRCPIARSPAVRAPTITVYAPEKPNGIALLVTPGGSYQRVVLDKEGSDLAPVFNARGYTLFVMTYRMPAWTVTRKAARRRWPMRSARCVPCGRGPPSGISTRKNRHYGLFRRGTRGGKPGDPL